MSELICDSCGRIFDRNKAYVLGDHDICDGTLREHRPTTKLQQLSLEECVYWLVIAEALGAASAAARKEPVYLRREMRACCEYAKDRNESRVQRRRYIVIARLCAVAANLIREEQRIREEKRTCGWLPGASCNYFYKSTSKHLRW